MALHFGDWAGQPAPNGVSRAGWPNGWIRLVTFAVPAVFLAIILGQPFVEPKWMFLDPLTAAEVSGDCCHSHYGFVSTLGVMMWVVTASVLLLTAFVLFVTDGPRKVIFFAFTGGLLTGWLALDDAFLLHETVLPAFGVPQNLVLMTYVVLGGLYMLGSWRVILRNDFWILAVGCGTLALSIAVDTIYHSLLPTLVDLEDSAKFFGMFCWMSFHVTTAVKYLIGACK